MIILLGASVLSLLFVLFVTIITSGATYYYQYSQPLEIPDIYDCIDPTNDTVPLKKSFTLTEEEKKMKTQKRQEDYLWDCNNLVKECVFAEKGCLVRPYYKKLDPEALT
jgi:hypothetical protein